VCLADHTNTKYVKLNKSKGGETSKIEHAQ